MYGLLEPPHNGRRLFVLIRKTQSDGAGAAIGYPMRHQRNGSERHDIALLRRMLELLAEIGGERNSGSFRRYRKPIDLGKGAERDIARNEEVAEEARVRDKARIDVKEFRRLADEARFYAATTDRVARLARPSSL